MVINLMEWKPCPFCGGEVSLSGVDEFSFTEYQKQKGKSVLGVWCSNYGCFVSMNYINDDVVSYEEALKELNERWNRRTK